MIFKHKQFLMVNNPIDKVYKLLYYMNISYMGYTFKNKKYDMINSVIVKIPYKDELNVGYHNSFIPNIRFSLEEQKNNSVVVTITFSLNKPVICIGLFISIFAVLLQVLILYLSIKNHVLFDTILIQFLPVLILIFNLFICKISLLLSSKQIMNQIKHRISDISIKK